MKFLGTLLLLSALAATGYSLTCKSCTHSSDKPCDGPTMTCHHDEVCVIAHTSLTLGSSVTQQYTITCGKPNNCNVTGSLTFHNGKVLMATSCCSKDNCSATFPTLPTESTKTNGRTCETCSSDKHKYCEGSAKLNCTGEETKCGRTELKLSGKMKQTDGIRGCATKSFCDILGHQNTDIDGLKVDVKTFCSDGAADLRVGYLAVIVTAVLTKFMF